MRLISEPVLKLNPRTFRSCGLATALFVSFTLELELTRDEARDALHHPLTGPLAALVNVAFICLAQVAVSASVEFVEHEVGQHR
jgi:uncharacterized metal-binding protein